jgi:hypothetical protein
LEAAFTVPFTVPYQRLTKAYTSVRRLLRLQVAEFFGLDPETLQRRGAVGPVYWGSSSNSFF